MTHEAVANLLKLEVERKGTTSLVRCHGRLIAGVSDVLYSCVRELIPDSKRIVLDLGALEYMDSMGLGALVRLYVTARGAGCSLELTHLGKRVRELLGMTHLLAVFTVIGEHGGLRF